MWTHQAKELVRPILTQTISGQADMNLHDDEVDEGEEEIEKEAGEKIVDAVRGGDWGEKDTGGAKSSSEGLSQDMAAEEEGEVGIHGREEEEEDEEGRTAKTMASPIVVSKREREEHELTHLPYRNWCEHCVRGRGRNMAHAAIKNRSLEDAVPRVALDYFFLKAP